MSGQHHPRPIESGITTTRRSITAAGGRLCADHLAFVRNVAARPLKARSSGSPRSLFDRFNSKYDATRMLRPDAGAFVYKMPGSVLSGIHLKWLASVQLFLSFTQSNVARAGDMKVVLQSFAQALETKPFACWQATPAAAPHTPGDLARRPLTTGGDDGATRPVDAGTQFTHPVNLKQHPVNLKQPAVRLALPAVSLTVPAVLKTGAIEGNAPRHLRLARFDERTAAENPYASLASQPQTFVAAMPRASQQGRQEESGRVAPAQHWLIRYLSERDAKQTFTLRAGGMTGVVFGLRAEGGREAAGVNRHDAWMPDRNGAVERFARSLNSFNQSIAQGASPERFTRGFSESFVLIDVGTDAARVLRRRSGATASPWFDADDAPVRVVSSGESAARAAEMRDGATFVRALDSSRWNAGLSAVFAQSATQEMPLDDFALRPTTVLLRAAGQRARRPVNVSREPASDAGANLFGRDAWASLVLTRPPASERRFGKPDGSSRTPEHLAEAVSRRALEMFVVVSGYAARSGERAGAVVRRGAGEASRVFGGGVMQAPTMFETEDELMPLVSREVGARGEHEFEEEGEGRFESIARELVSLRREAPLRPPRVSYVFAQTLRPVAGEPPPQQQQSRQQKMEERKDVVEMVRREIQESMRAGAATVKFSRADYTSIADQVYSTLVRRLMVERERLGLHAR